MRVLGDGGVVEGCGSARVGVGEHQGLKSRKTIKEFANSHIGAAVV